MSDRVHRKQRPLLPEGYQYGDGRRQNLVFLTGPEHEMRAGELQSDPQLGVAIRFIKHFDVEASKHPTEADAELVRRSRRWVEAPWNAATQLMQRTGDQTI